MERATPSTLSRTPSAGVAVSLPTRYRVTRLIGTGGMAVIWEAEDTLLSRAVAIKVLAENLAQQEQFVLRFEREARTAASLSGHPNVLTIYDVGEHERRPFIVMECLPAGTVADRLQSAGPPPRRQAVEWLRQVASALDFAHERGVVHRDIKPANLLFDDRGRLVIADFGIARAAYDASLTASGELLGTGAYISPEQARGDSGTPASDRYSLAVVAFELLTGSRPFEGGDFAAQALHHLQSEPRLPTELSPDLPNGVNDVLLHGLAKDPAGRWPSASGLVEALAAALEAGNETPYPSESALPTGDKDRKRPLRRSATVTLFVLAAIVTGVLVASALTGGKEAAREPAAPGKRTEQAGRDGEASSSRSSGAPAPQTGTPADSAASTREGARLNDEGFTLMKARRYDEAIPLLQRAVAAFPRGSRDLNYAYALYNLARSLRLAGRPAEAIPLLERRIRFPNQRETVARELAAAREAAADSD